MPTPTFTTSSVEALDQTGECVIEMVVSSGYGSGKTPPPTTGQLWPRGNL